MENTALITALVGLDSTATVVEKSDRPSVLVPAERLFEYLAKLQSTAELKFDFLMSHTAVHWNEAKKFELLYQLFSTEHRHYCLVTAEIPDSDPVISSVSSLWAVAEWEEREAYDLFGIRYAGNPDLRRLFLDDEWKGFPLRKDYHDDFMLENK